MSVLLGMCYNIYFVMLYFTAQATILEGNRTEIRNIQIHQHRTRQIIIYQLTDPQQG